MLLKSALLALLVWFVVCSSQTCPLLDVVIAIDASGSICKPTAIRPIPPCNDWFRLISFVRSLATAFNVGVDGTRVSVVLFATEASVLWPLDRFLDMTSLLQAIDNIQFTGGWTNTAEGIFKTIDAFRGSGDRSEVRNVAFVITDSHPTINVNALPVALNAIRQTNIEVYTIGVTSFIDEVTLRSISSPPQVLNQNYFKSDTLISLNEIINPIRNQICTIVITQRPPSTLRQQALTTTADNCVSSKKDVVFVVDASGSICERDPNFVFGRVQTCQNWRDLVDFIHDITNSFTIGPDHFRVGLVMFNETASIVWGLNSFLDKSTLLPAFRSLQYVGGFTNTGAALGLLMESFGGPGDRPDAPNVALIVTDAMSTLNPQDVKDKLNVLRQSPIQVYALGVTQNVDRIALKELSSFPQILNQNYFLSSSFSEIDKIRSQVEQSVCSDISTTTTTIISTTRFTPVTKRVTRCFLPTTTTTTTTTTVFCNQEVLDIVIAIDSSGSICDTDPNYRYGRDITCDNWNHIVAFVRSFVNSFNVANERTLFSVVMFHSIAQLKWDLTRYLTKEDLLKEIEGLKFVGGWTDTAGGLRRMLEVFNGASNRPNVPDVAVIITDGEPTTNLEDLPIQRDLLRGRGVKVFAIGVTNAINEETLRDLSSSPSMINKNYFITSDFSQVGQINFEIRNQICQR